MRLMMETSRVATTLPGAFFYVRSPAPVDFVIYYGALIAVLTGFVFRTPAAGLVGIVFAALIAFYLLRWQAGPENSTLTVLPLNGGNGIYVQSSRNDENLLVDCGNASAFDSVVKPFLRAQGVNHLPCLALTHGDVRQVGGAESLLALLPVQQIVTGPTRFRSRAYRQIVEHVDRISRSTPRLESGRSGGSLDGTASGQGGSFLTGR